MSGFDGARSCRPWCSIPGEHGGDCELTPLSPEVLAYRFGVLKYDDAATERAAVVAYLRGCARGDNREHIIVGAIADAIEAGEHVKEKP